MAERSGVGDQIDRDARRVRHSAAVHELRDYLNDALGRHYLTACGEVLHAAQGAVLTTVHANCWACVPGGVR